MAIAKASAAKLLEEFRYTLGNDVNMRLKGCVIRYEGKPVYVSQTLDNLEIQLFYILDGAALQVHSSDSALDIQSPQLGWINFAGTRNEGPVPCGYLMRSAKNSQKQGFAPNHQPMFLPGERGSASFSWSEMGDLIPIGKMMVGDYPSIKKVTMPGSSGGAVSREWALYCAKHRSIPHLFTVYHRTTAVGTYFANTGIFFFRKDRLTKTRRASLMEVFQNMANFKEASRYGIKEQP